MPSHHTFEDIVAKNEVDHHLRHAFTDLSFALQQVQEYSEALGGGPEGWHTKADLTDLLIALEATIDEAGRVVRLQRRRTALEEKRC